MGTWSNIKENIRDIGQGIVSVIKGKPKTTAERQTARDVAEFEKIRANPRTGDTLGYTPVKDSSGGVIYHSGGGGGGRASVSPAPSGASAAQITEQKRLKAIAERLARRLKAIAERLAREKAERARIAAEKLRQTRTQEALRDKTIDSRQQLKRDIDRARERERLADDQRRIDQDISRIRTSSSGRVNVTKPGEGSSAQRTSTYYGDIVVPGTEGLTATEYKRELAKKAREKYGVGSGFRSEEEVKIVEVKPVEVKPKESIVTSSKDISFKTPKVDRTGQTYSSTLGGFISTEELYKYEDKTAIISPLTSEEAIKIKEVDYGGSAKGIWGGIKDIPSDIKDTAKKITFSILDKTKPLTDTTSKVQTIVAPPIAFGIDKLKPQLDIFTKDVLSVKKKVEEKAKKVYGTSLVLGGIVDKKVTPIIKEGFGIIARDVLIGKEKVEEKAKKVYGTSLYLGGKVEKVVTPKVKEGFSLFAKDVLSVKKKIEDTTKKVYGVTSIIGGQVEERVSPVISFGIDKLKPQLDIFTKDVLSVKKKVEEKAKKVYGTSLYLRGIVDKKARANWYSQPDSSETLSYWVSGQPKKITKGERAEIYEQVKGFAETRLKIREESEKEFTSDMAFSFPSTYKPTQAEISQEIIKIKKEVGFVSKAGVVAGAYVINPAVGYAAGGIIFNKEIVTGIGKGIDYVAPPITKEIKVTTESKDEFGNIIYTTETSERGTGFARKGSGRQILRGALYGASILIPGVGYAYGTQIVKGLATSPRQTIGGIATYAKENPYEFGAMLSTGKAIEVAKVKITKLRPDYKAVETTVIGERIIKGVKGEGGKFDIGIIPERGSKLDIKPSKLAKKYASDIPLIDKPKLPIFTKLEKIGIDVAKKQGDTYVGSGAAKVLIKGTRTGLDVDIVSKNPLKTAELIAKKSGEGTKISPHKVKGIDVVAVTDKFGNKIDVVSRSGYSSARSLFGYGDLKTVEVEGLKLLRPQELLKKKVEVIKDIGLTGEKASKTIKDIKAYTGGKIDIDVRKPTLTDPYGYTRQELGSLTGTTGTITHASTGLFGWFKKKTDIIAQPDNPMYGLFGTPPDIKTGMPMARASRLGAEATMRDLLTGKATVGKPSSKPQIIVFEGQKIGAEGKFYVPFKSTEFEVVTPLVDAAGKPIAIKKIGSGGITVINKKPVRLVLADFVAKGDLSAETLGLIEKSKQGKLSVVETTKLKKLVTKETGIDYLSTDKLYFDPNRFTPKIVGQTPQETIVSTTVGAKTESISSSSLSAKPYEVVSISRPTVSYVSTSIISKPSGKSSVSRVSTLSSTISKSSKVSSIISSKTSAVSRPSRVSSVSRVASAISKQSSVSRPSRPSSPISKVSSTKKPIISLPSRMLKRVREQPEIFEAFILKGGKEVSIGKGGKKVLGKKLSKKLKGELSASGFLTKGGKKIKATETGLLKDVEFRVGKRKEYLIVERKEKRLRKAGTGKLIQPFRFNGKKSKKSNLFNL